MPTFIDLSMPHRSIGELLDKENQAPNTGTKKRKSTDAAQPPNNVDLDDIYVPMPYGMPDKNCDQVRRKITRLLDSGEMKVGEFCNTLGVANNALNRFRGQTGAQKGDKSEVYVKAWKYFEKREIAGLKMPNKNKKLKTADGESSTGASAGASKSASAHPDISAIRLEDEESDDVPVYESCDEVRKKIAAYLRKPGVTQAQFCRDLYGQLHSDKRPKSIQSSQLTAFRGNKGANRGNTSSVFYAAYVLFEKIRIAEGKPKSKHRQEMEEVWPEGFDRETSSNQK
ncbi:hypothetical protein LTR85_011245 [Meristemomyces frigidus]|nr:hypothetical protein LTR85_011245 [Meristemomyces frigidus]